MRKLNCNEDTVKIINRFVKMLERSIDAGLVKCTETQHLM